MTTPARLLHAAAGSPPVAKTTEEVNGPCWLCGFSCSGRGVSKTKAVGESFTDHAEVAVPVATHLCVPCVWTLTGKPPATFRLWSIAWRTDRELAPSHYKVDPSLLVPGAHLTAKNDLSEIRSILLDPPADGSSWFCTLADSGQKHVVPFARVNYCADRWVARLEKDDVTGSPRKLGELLHCCAQLYVAGFNREEIHAGNPSPGKLVRAGLSFWRERNNYLRAHRGSSLFELAIFLLRKKELDDVQRATRRFALPGLGSSPSDRGNAIRKH